MANDGRVEPDEIEPAYRRVIEAHPDAGIAAVDHSGLFCDIPPAVHLTTQSRLEGRAGIDLVAAESRAVVLEQFRQLPERGANETDVRSADGRPLRYALFDTRAVYGVVMLVVIEGEYDGARLPGVILPSVTPVRPRYGWVTRSDVAELIDVDDGMLAMLGYSREEFAGLETVALVHPDDYALVVGQWFDLLTAPPAATRRCRVRYRRQDGSYLWVELTVTQYLDNPQQPHMLSEMVDISEEMAAMDEVWQSRELLQRLTEALPVGVLQLDVRGNIVYANDRLPQIVGVARADTLSEQFANIVDDDRHDLEAAVEKCLSTGSDVDTEFRFRPQRSHVTRYAQVAVRALRDRSESVAGAILCVSDVTDSTHMRQELEVRASRDMLTQCLNRAAVMSEIERALERPSRGTAVAFVDLDAFKPINDELGHAAGDELLKAVAAALQRVVRGNDVVGRLGGDEFIVLCPDVTSREMALDIGGRIADAVCFETAVGGKSVRVQASVGMAWSAGGNVSVDALVAASDEAMYESKRNGDNRPVLAPPLVSRS